MGNETSSPRARVVAAGRRLFLEHGYGDTSIGAIAHEAGVAIQTIYSAFGSKVGVLAAVQDETLAGDARPVPMSERPWALALADLPVDRALASVVRHLGEATARAARLHGVIRDAAADPGVRDLLDTLHAQRARTCLTVAERVVDGTAHAATARDLADGLYVTLGVEAYELLVTRRRWTRRRWLAWAETTLRAQLDVR